MTNVLVAELSPVTNLESGTPETQPDIGDTDQPLRLVIRLPTPESDQDDAM